MRCWCSDWIEKDIQPQMKSAQATAMFVMLIAAQICDASVVVFAFGKKTVIIAGDSRETYSDGTFRDTACKLGSYGDNVIFTHVGIASFGVTDLMSEARKAVADSAARESSQSIANERRFDGKS